MFFMLLLTIISASPTSLDTVELKGTKGITYRMFINDNELCFQYQAKRNWSEPTLIDKGNIREFAVRMTPDDYLHLAYCKEGRVCYRTTSEPIKLESIKHNKKPIWTTWVFISPYFTEPASNPSIKIEGEFVKVTWQAPAEEDSLLMTTWQRARWLNEAPYVWETPECLGETLLKQ